MEQSPIKIIIDDKIPFIRGVFEPFVKVEYLSGSKVSPEDVKDAIALITRTRTKCNEALLRNSSIRCIASATIGYDHIDTDYCEMNGISWTNAPGCNSGSVAQYLVSALLYICEKEQMAPSNFTLGIIGVGNVGKKVETFARALGFKVLLSDPPRARVEGDGKFVSLSKIAKKADIITFHTPLIKEGDDKTFHIFDAKFLSKLGKQPYVINTSRGEVTCNNTLLEGLKNDALKGVVLDVWEKEPYIKRALLDKVLLGTPHIAGYSVDGKANGTKQSVEAVKKCLGLSTTAWSPKDLPLPESTKIKVNCKKQALHSLMFKAAMFTYDVEAESNRLKEVPEHFEQFRNNYHVRREYTSFNVELKNKTKEAKQLFELFGFNVD